MTIIRPKFFTVFFSVILVYFIVLLNSCKERIEKTNQILTKDSLPDIAVNEVELSFSDSGTVRMKLYAPDLVDYTEVAEPYTEFVKGVRVYFFDTKQNTESSLRADYAHFDSKKDLWDYRGKVELKNQKGDILTTEQLYADRKREKLYSQKLVKIATSDGSMIEGAEGFTSNLDFTEYEFRDVTSEIPGK